MGYLGKLLHGRNRERMSFLMGNGIFPDPSDVEFESEKSKSQKIFFGSWTFWAAPGSKIKSGDFFETQLVRLDRIENWLSRHLRRARRVLKMSEGQDFRCRRGETSVDGGKEVETGRARESFTSLERVQSSWAFGFLECESTPWKLKLLSEKSFLLNASIQH